MKTQQCGFSGLELPVLGIGCWSFGGGEGDYWGSQDDREAEAVVEQALNQGAVYLDTAEMYNEGRSEAALGRILKHRRAEAIIGSKAWPNHFRPDLLRQACEDSLRRLDTPYLDLYMLHWPIADMPIQPVFDMLAALQTEGKIRYIGVSNFGARQIHEAAAAAEAAGTRIVANQVCYSLLSRAIEFEILPACQDLGIGVLGYMPLQQGLLTGKYRSADELPQLRTRTRHFNGARPLSRHGEPGAEMEVFEALEAIRLLSVETGVPMAQLAIHWATHQPGVTCAITGVRNQPQLEEAITGTNLELPSNVIERLSDATEAVKHILGANADYFQGAAGSRIH